MKAKYVPHIACNRWSHVCISYRWHNRCLLIRVLSVQHLTFNDMITLLIIIIAHQTDNSSSYLQLNIKETNLN